MHIRVNRRYQFSEDEIKLAVTSWLIRELDLPNPPTLDDVSIEVQNDGEVLAFVAWEVEDTV